MRLFLLLFAGLLVECVSMANIYNLESQRQIRDEVLEKLRHDFDSVSRRLFFVQMENQLLTEDNSRLRKDLEKTKDEK